MEVIQSEVEVDDAAVLVALAGPSNDRLREIEKELSIDVSLRGHTIFLRGARDRVAVAERFLAEASALVKKGLPMRADDVARALRLLQTQPKLHLSDMFSDRAVVQSGKRTITPRWITQKAYVDAIASHDLTFGIGPAGTGKTYLAMACAVAALESRAVKRIILTRPAVEAGEHLGFLPGDLEEKVNPYLRPLYDALFDMVDRDRAQNLVAKELIEVAPLAFMRGRTLADAFVILDEAQNTTSEQMRMFLTRIGPGAKAVVTGDVTQVDLPPGKISGLVEAHDILKHVPEIRFCHFSDADVVRHPLVQKIVRAYENKGASP